MLARKPLPRDVRLDSTPGASRAKSWPFAGRLNRFVNQNVCPDNIWEKQIGRRTESDLLERCNVKISCPACAAKYSIADEKVQDRLAKIRCRKCGATIVIDGKTSPPHVYAADGSSVEHAAALAPLPSSAEPAREFSVDFGDNDQRTLPLSEVIQAYNRGEINADTFLWAEGMNDWKALGEISEVVDALHAAAVAPEESPKPPRAASVGRQANASPWDAPAKPAPRESD